MVVQLTALTFAQIQEVIRLAEIKAANNGQGTPQKLTNISKTNPHFSEWQNLVYVIDPLPSAAKQELMALAWLGQGRIGNNLHRWDELLQAAGRELRKDLSLQIIMIPSLHKCLVHGLEMIGHAL